LATYLDMPVIRRGAYAWHRVELSEAHALASLDGSPLQLVAPDGRVLAFRYDRHVEHPNGDWTWIGHLQGGAPGEEAILTFGERAAFGSIAQPSREPLRLTLRNGVSWLVETDPAKLARLSSAITRPRVPDFFIPPKRVRKPVPVGRVVAPVAGAEATAASSLAATGTVVDVVLGYTSGFAAGLGGQSQAVTRLNYLVDVTNQAYFNSQVGAQVRLVQAVQVNYPDATSNQTALQELTGFVAPSTQTTPNTAFAALRAARDEYGADLVSLVRKFNTPENGGCGIAWLIGGGQSGIDASDEYFGYSVVSDGTDMDTDGSNYFCRDETLAHELGHNMGSAHDRDTADGDDNVLQASEYGLFPYSFGYKTGIGTGNFYTVMAYGESGQARYRVFSNPRITLCGGYACGTADADNASSLSQAIPTVATFRAGVLPPPATPPVRDDVDADGNSDLLLQNAAQGWLAYWTMAGATPVRYSSVFQQPPGFVQVATGDLNGDRRMDVVFARSADNSLVGWFGDGNGFVQAPLRQHAAGWQVVLAGDVDGDGKSDLVLENQGLRQLAYWIMDGAAASRYSTAFVEPDGYRISASGDFNADGKLDLLWMRPTDRALLMWLGDGSGFTSWAMASPGASWTVLAVGDTNGDRKDDLVLANTTRRLARIQTLNGPSVTSGSQLIEIPVGYMFAGSGDHDGDGRLDLVWERSSDRTLLWWKGSSGSTFQAMSIRAHAVGWQVRDNARRSRFFAADIDASQSSDLLLFAPVGQSLSYMVMSGSTNYGFAPQAYPAAGTPVASGDFDADGRVDVVVQRSQGRVVLLQRGSDSFTELPLPTPAAGWVVRGAGDVDGDGRHDLLLDNEEMAATAFWIIDGGRVLRYSSAFARPSGYAVAARGDLNRDGRLDLVWARTSDRSLLLWQGDGSGFAALPIGNYAPGWSVAGAGDIDGDERSDLVLTGAGSAAYWIMQGNNAVRYSPGFLAPQGSRLGALGDYDGNARLDLVWDNLTSGTVDMWMGDGNGFNAYYAGSHNPGYYVLP
jgi:hypothetical protein